MKAETKKQMWFWFISLFVAVIAIPISSILEKSLDDYRTRQLIDVKDKYVSVSIDPKDLKGFIPQKITVEWRFYIQNITADKLVDLKPDDTQFEIKNINANWGVGAVLRYEPNTAMGSDKFVKLKPGEVLECIVTELYIPKDKSQEEFYSDIETIGDVTVSANLYIRLPSKATFQINSNYDRLSVFLNECYNQLVEDVKVNKNRSIRVAILKKR
jgi:hypothetical protein